MTTVNLKSPFLIRKSHRFPPGKSEVRGTERTIENKKNRWQRLLDYSARQQQNRLGWLAFALALQGCIMAPVTIYAIVLQGNSIILWVICTFSFAITEVVNLAAMPTRVTIPALLGSIVLDLLIIATSFIVA